MSSFSAVEAERGEVMIPATAASIVPSAGFFPSIKQSSPKQAKSVSPQLHSRILGSTISSPPLAGTASASGAAPAANTTTTNPHGMSRAASATSLQQQHNALANVEPRMQERVLKAFSGSGSSSTTGGAWLPSSSSSGSATTSAGGPLRRTLRDSVDQEEDPYMVSGSTGACTRPHDLAAPIIPQLNAPRLGSTSSARQEHHVDSAASRHHLEQPSLEEIFDVGGSRSVFSETKDDDSSIRIIGQKGEQEQLVQVENRSRRQIFQDRLFSKLDSDKSKSPKSQHSRSPVLQQRTISPRTRTTTAALRHLHDQQEHRDKSPGRMMSQSMENVSLSTGGFRSASRRQSKENIGSCTSEQGAFLVNCEHDYKQEKDHEMLNSLSGSRQVLDRSIYEEVLDNVMRSSSKSSSSTVGAGNVVHAVPVASSTGLTNQTLQDEPLNIEDKPSESESIRPAFAAAEQEQEEQLITRQSLLQDKHFREHSTSRKSSPKVDLLLHSVNSLSFASAPSRLGLGVYQTASTNGKMLKRVNVTSEDIHKNLAAVLGGSRASGSTSKSSNSAGKKKSSPLDGHGDEGGDLAEQHVDQPHDHRGGPEALLELAEVVPYQSEVVQPSAGVLAQDDRQRVEQVLVADEFVSQLLVVHPQEKRDETSQINAPPDHGRADELALAVTLNRGSPSPSPRRAPSMGRKSAGAAGASSSSSSYQHSRSGAAGPDSHTIVPKETTFSTSNFPLDSYSGQQHHEQYSGKKQNSRRSVGAKPEDTSFSELKAATTRARSRERTSTPRGYRSTRTSRMREEQRKRERDQSQGRGGSNVVALMRSLSRTSASGDKNTAVDVMPLRAAGTTAGAAAVSSTSFVVPRPEATGFSSTGSGNVAPSREAQEAAINQLRGTTTQHNNPHTPAPVSLVQVVPLASEAEDSEGSGGCEGTTMKHTEVVVEQDHAINSSNSRSMNNTTSLSATSYHRTSSSSATKTSARTRGRILTTQEPAPSAAAGAKTPNRLPSKNLQTSQSATASRSRSAGRYTPRGVSKELYQTASGSEMSQGPTASLSSSSGGAAAIRSYHNILAAGAQRHLNAMGNNSQNSQNTAHNRLPSQQSLVQNLLLAREVGGDSALDGGYYEHNYLHPGGKATPTPATAGTNKSEATTSHAEVDHEPQSNAGAYQQGRSVQQGVVPLGSSTASSSTNTPARGLSTRAGTTSNRRSPLLGKVLTPRPETEPAEGKTAEHVGTDRVSKIEASNSNLSSSSRQASSNAAVHDHPTTSVSSAQQHPSSSPKLSTKTTTPRNAALSQLYVATANRQKQHNSQHYTQNSTIGAATSSKNTSKTSSSSATNTTTPRHAGLIVNPLPAPDDSPSSMKAILRQASRSPPPSSNKKKLQETLSANFGILRASFEAQGRDTKRGADVARAAYALGLQANRGLGGGVFSGGGSGRNKKFSVAEYHTRPLLPVSTQKSISSAHRSPGGVVSADYGDEQDLHDVVGRREVEKQAQQRSDDENVNARQVEQLHSHEDDLAAMRNADAVVDDIISPRIFTNHNDGKPEEPRVQHPAMKKKHLRQQGPRDTGPFSPKKRTLSGRTSPSSAIGAKKESYIDSLEAEQLIQITNRLKESIFRKEENGSAGDLEHHDNLFHDVGPLSSIEIEKMSLAVSTGGGGPVDDKNAHLQGGERSSRSRKEQASGTVPAGHNLNGDASLSLSLTSLFDSAKGADEDDDDENDDHQHDLHADTAQKENQEQMDEQDYLDYLENQRRKLEAAGVLQRRSRDGAAGAGVGRTHEEHQDRHSDERERKSRSRSNSQRARKVTDHEVTSRRHGGEVTQEERYNEGREDDHSAQVEAAIAVGERSAISPITHSRGSPATWRTTNTSAATVFQPAPREEHRAAVLHEEAAPLLPSRSQSGGTARTTEMNKTSRSASPKTRQELTSSSRLLQSVANRERAGGVADRAKESSTATNVAQTGIHPAEETVNKSYNKVAREAGAVSVQHPEHLKAPAREIHPHNNSNANIKVEDSQTTTRQKPAPATSSEIIASQDHEQEAVASQFAKFFQKRREATVVKQATAQVEKAEMQRTDHTIEEQRSHDISTSSHRAENSALQEVDEVSTSVLSVNRSRILPDHFYNRPGGHQEPPSSSSHTTVVAPLVGGYTTARQDINFARRPQGRADANNTKISSSVAATVNKSNISSQSTPRSRSNVSNASMFHPKTTISQTTQQHKQKQQSSVQFQLPERSEDHLMPGRSRILTSEAWKQEQRAAAAVGAQQGSLNSSSAGGARSTVRGGLAQSVFRKQTQKGLKLF
ncbi:unnamed protein product [Amoebophrya sp. A120]|nr:unnamed protein product [Amoebophrya sp. A120]|eukprot:GSA120T00023690001.1